MTKTDLTAEQIEADILSDQSTSYWLKERIKECLERDVVDAISDVEALHKLLDAKYNELIGKEK